MKRLLISLCLALGTATTAQAVPYCYKGTIVQTGFNYLSPAQLQAWWNTNGVPANNGSPHWYVAFHAAHQYCTARYGSGWIVTAWGPGPSPYNISQGISFRCGRCIPGMEPAPEEPGPEEPGPTLPEDGF